MTKDTHINRNTRHLQTKEIATLVILLGWLLLNLLTLTKHPVPMCDEANYGVVAYQFATHGVFTSPIHGISGPNAINITSVGRLLAVGESLLFAIFGVTLYVARLYNMLAWGGCVCFVYLIARRLYSHNVGLLSALLFGIPIWTFARWRLARPEAWTTLALSLAFWLYLRLREQPTFWRAFVVGLAGILALDYHMIAIFFLPSYGLLIIWTSWQRRNWSIVAGFVVGAMVGAVYFILAHAYPDASVAYRGWFVSVPDVHTYRVSVGGIATTFFPWLWQDFFTAYRGLAGVETTIVLAGIAIALSRRRQNEGALLFIYLGGLVLFAAIYADKTWLQISLWIPFMSIMGVRFIQAAAEWLHTRFSRIPIITFAYLLLAPWLVLNILGEAWLLRGSWNSDWEGALDQMRALAPPDAGIWGQESWWYMYPDGRFLSQLALRGQLRGEEDGIISETELLRFFLDNGIDHLIVLEDYHCHATTLTPPSFTVEEAADRYCNQVGSVDGFFSESGGISTARVYRCDFAGP